MDFEDFEKFSAHLGTQSQPVTGYLHTGEYINIPLISHVIDNLYVGGCQHGVNVGDYFSHIFSMYPWERYAFDENATNLVETKMYDSPGVVDVDTVEDLVPRVREALASGGNVLVHCQAGINRSNLIAGSTLKTLGYSGERAVALLREKRSPLVLANRTFLDYVLDDRN